MVDMNLQNIYWRSFLRNLQSFISNVYRNVKAKSRLLGTQGNSERIYFYIEKGEKLSGVSLEQRNLSPENGLIHNLDEKNDLRGRREIDKVDRKHCLREERPSSNVRMRLSAHQSGEDSKNLC